MSVTRNVIAGVARDIKEQKIKVSSSKLQGLKRPTYIHGVDEPVTGAIPLFTGHREIVADDIDVWNDLHGTLVNVDFLEKAGNDAKKEGIKKLLIAGDLLNNGAVSPHKKRQVNLEANLETEFDFGRQILEFAASIYDEIEIMPGNHDLWIIEAFNGAVSFTTAMRMLVVSDAVRSKLNVTDYDRVTILTSRDKWVVSHGHGYNRTPLVEAEKLSKHFEASIIKPHQHNSAGPVRSANGKHVLIDSGGFIDQRKAQYVQMNTSTFPVWTNGYVRIQGGKGRLITE